MRFSRAWRGVLVIAFLGTAAGCSRAPRDLLVVYSGDCQGYIEPCG